MIKILDKDVASRIAAGEIIERPSSVVRELLDNAIDSNATSITVDIKEGGKTYISVSDNGSGMNKEDLSLALESHATSKLKEIDDLYHIRSMGFRGEALYALSSCSKIVITTAKDKMAYKLTCDNAKEIKIEEAAREKGTIVEVFNLFSELPVRKAFLKRDASELGMIKKVFNEKAMAFNEIDFYLNADDKSIYAYKSTDKKQRVLDIISETTKVNAKDFQEISSKTPSYSLYAISSSISVFRSDRSYIKIIVNNRVIDDYSLVQAIVYGYGELLPGGYYPYTILFIDILPTLIDFNIHPTKREVRFRNKSEVHHSISTLFKNNIKRHIPKLEEIIKQDNFNFQKDEYIRDPVRFNVAHNSNYSSQSFSIPKQNMPKNDWLGATKEIIEKEEEVVKEVYIQDTTVDFEYIGQLFKLYLLAQKGEELYIIDQHAAHERIIFDQIKENIGSQELLFPRRFEVDNDVDIYLRDNLDIYKQIGLIIERIEDGLYELKSTLNLYKSIEDDVINFIQHNACDSDLILTTFYANVACKKAIKANDYIDPIFAIRLLKDVFALSDPVCPHGRTFVVKLDKQDLNKMVGRTN